MTGAISGESRTVIIYRDPMLRLASGSLIVWSLCTSHPSVAQSVGNYDWRGAYAGVTLGSGELRASAHEVWNPGPPGPQYFDAQSLGALAIVKASQQKLHERQLIYGGHVGYNLMAGHVVVGLEADFSPSGVHGVKNAAQPYPVGIPGSFAIGNAVAIDNLATLRGRYGLAFDRSMIYVTGGFAFANTEFTRSFSDRNISPAQTATESRWTTGRALGGGIEHALSKHFILRAEYLRVDFGRMSNSGAVGTPGFTNIVTGQTSDLRSDIGRLGVMYKF